MIYTCRHYGITILLLFIADQEESRLTVDSDEPLFYNLEESSSSNHSHQQSPLPSPTFPAVTRSDSSSSIPSTSSFKSKKARNEQKRSIDAALKEDDEFDGIGINVACKLRRMDEEQRLHAEMLINKILLHGFKGRLQEKTDVTALKFAFPQPPVPHAVLDLQQTLANKSNSPPQETNNNYSLAVQYVMQDENNEELSNYLVIN